MVKEITGYQQFAAMLASCTRIVGVILVFPLVLGMYRDSYSGKIKP